MALEEGLVLLVEVGCSSFAFEASAVAEVVLLPRLAVPPTSPTAVAGVMNLRGEAVVVVRLSLLLGLPVSVPGLFTHVVILRRPTQWAVMVDRALEVRRIQLGAAVPPPPDMAFNECVAAVLASGGGWLPILAPERLLTSHERQLLDDFQQAAVRRLAALGGGPVEVDHG